jgi:Family of unknown function (DUF5690)
MARTIRERLNNNDTALAIWATVAAFSTYFCMYAFRKPFTAGTFDGQTVWGMDFKIALVIAQVLGYMLSKFIGIKVISEMSAQRRPLSILVLIGFSWLALLIFTVAPTEFKPFCLFMNGIPLGLIWGIVFSFLEGRRLTELLGAGLAVSFIVSSGVVKSVGKWLMTTYGYTEFQMPFTVGAIFIVPLMVSVWMLMQIPPPSVSDKILRSERRPMTGADRRALFNRYAFGIICLTAFYFVLTAFRDFRDNFIVEIWADLGYTDASVLTTTEIPIAISVLILVALLILVKDNAMAFWLNHLLILFGGVMVILSNYLYENHFISAYTWMIMVGFGLYLSYILFQSLIFDRMIATFKEAANVGFLMYVADAFGYLGSIGSLLLKNFGGKNISHLEYFVVGGYVMAAACFVLVLASYYYFFEKYEQQEGSGEGNGKIEMAG